MSFPSLAFNLSGITALAYMACASPASVLFAGPEAAPVVAAQPPVANDGPDVAAVSRADDGLFYVWGEVNGTKVRFLVDTGASVTVLTERDARRAGVAVGRRQTGMRMRTASGSTAMRWVQIDHVRVAGNDLHDLDAAVMGDGPAVSLLGQNLLTRLGSVSIDGNQLRLR